MKDIKEETLKADQVVKNADSSSIPKTSSDIVERAKIRMAKGNPPGKDDSLGDAISGNLYCRINTPFRGHTLYY